MKKYYLALTLLSMLACTMPLTVVMPTLDATSCLPQNTPREVGDVLNVIDGDTIDVQIDGVEYRVRYIGMDSPEIDEPYYDQATGLNLDFVEGRQVTLIKDVSETDQYGRLLRYVFVEDVFVNYELVKQGYAAVATFPPDVACSDQFIEAEQLARIEGVGLWEEQP